MTVNDLSKDGLQWDQSNWSEAANDDTIPVAAGKRIFVAVFNDSAGNIDVTIPAQKDSVNTVPGGTLDIPDIEVEIGAGETYLIGPFPSAYVNDDGDVTVNYSDITDVSRRAFAAG